MAYRNVKVAKDSVVPHIKVDSKAPIFLPENKRMLDRMGCTKIVYNTNGQLAIERFQAIPGGYGRSIRAVVLGLHYKCARRKSGAIDQFSPSLFNYPQDSSALIKRMKEKKLK